jgi:zinc protease
VPTDKAPRVQIVAAPPAAKVVEGYVGKAAVAAGENFDPSPTNLQARTQTFTLGDGLKVSLLPKRTRGETVVVNARFRFGDERAITGRVDAAGLAGAMLMRGSRSLSRQQIDQRFEDLKTNAGISGGAQTASISLNSRKAHLADALALAADILRNPAFPESEFEQLRLQAITFTEASRKEPGSVAGLALARHFDPWPVGHPYDVRTLDESLAALKAMKIEDLRAFHRDFYGSSEGEISVVGDFDPVVVRQQLEALFAGWKSPKPFARISTRYTDVPAASKRFETPDKPNAVLLAQHNLSLKVTDPDYAAVMVANNILGGGALKSRLGDRIRQKEGLSYGVQSSVRADDSRDRIDDSGSFSVQAIAAPQNMAKVEAAIREELARLVKDGVTADELRDAVSGILTQRERSRAEDGTVAGMLSDQLYYGRTMAFTAELDAQFKALTVEQVNAAIRKLLKPDSLSVYVAGDFAGAAAPAAAAAK